LGHAGKLVTGDIGATEVIVLSGRVHLYEGRTAQEVTFGVRELARRGVRSLILTNAAGGINLTYQPGDLVLISDHINLTGVNPLTGPNDDSLGPRFPDMSDAYSARFREIAQAASAGPLHEGVYAGLQGPSFETPAEIRYLRSIGADLVGMSTVLETLAANHGGMRVLGISCVSNMAAGVTPHKLSHQEVLETGERVKDELIELLRVVVPELAG
jgi:purine-nucleoside phosphorylase